MNVLVAVVDVGLRALWEDILRDHGHRTLPVSPDLPEWREAHTFALDVAIVELAPARSEYLELGRRLRQTSVSRPNLMVLVQPEAANEMLVALRTSPDTIVFGHPDRRTAAFHLLSLERTRRVSRPSLPPAHELVSRYRLKRGVVAGRQAAIGHPIPPAAPASNGPATILLIDDEPRLRHTLSLELQRVGYHVLEANGGDQGLEMLARWGDEIAAVVTDQRMARVSGLEVLKQVRQRPRRVPVVLLSEYPSIDPPEGVNGPDACLRKPFPLPDLSRTVHRLLGGEGLPS